MPNSPSRKVTAEMSQCPNHDDGHGDDPLQVSRKLAVRGQVWAAVRGLGHVRAPSWISVFACARDYRSALPADVSLPQRREQAR